LALVVSGTPLQVAAVAAPLRSRAEVQRWDLAVSRAPTKAVVVEVLAGALRGRAQTRVVVSRTPTQAVAVVVLVAPVQRARARHEDSTGSSTSSGQPLLQATRIVGRHEELCCCRLEHHSCPVSCCPHRRTCRYFQKLISDLLVFGHSPLFLASHRRLDQPLLCSAPILSLSLWLPSRGPSMPSASAVLQHPL